MTRSLLAFAAAGSLLVTLVAPHLPVLGPLEFDALVGFLAGLAPVLLLTWVIARGELSLRATVGLMVVGVAGGLALSWLGWVGAAVPFKVALAAGGGRLLGRQVAEGWWLAVVAITAIVVDSWSVFAGPTKVLVEQTPGVLDYLLIHFPVLGFPGAGLGLGLSDVVFLALLTTGAAATGLRPRAGFAGMGGSLVVAVVVALVWRSAVPALPFVALAFLLTQADLLAGRLLRRGLQ
ncbi:MAG: hypothetical protein KKA32_09490 [Actinobacteria bacterium]|nr:hypothetical protein [Actinomycetota bacterium]